MAAGDITYTTSSSLTLTGLVSLASGGYWGSAAIDFTTGHYQDAHVGGKIVVNGTIAADGYIAVFAYGSYDGTTMTAGLNNVSLPGTITWGTNTGVLSYQDLRYLGSAQVDDTDDGDTVEFGPFSLAAAFGMFLPEKAGIVIYNATGAALDATGSGNEIVWNGIKIAAA